MKTLVSVVGRINAGKDTIANYLIDHKGFRKESFANSLKDCVSVVFGWDRELLEGVTEESRKWREQKDEFWSKELGRDVTPRRVLQEWGTEVVREGFHQNTWVASFKKRMLAHNVTRDIKRFVLTDGRFPNEFKVIKDMGGVIVRIDRGPDPEWYEDALESCQQVRDKGLPYDQTDMGLYWPMVHPSEWAWADLEFDHHIKNDGSLLQFQNKVKDLAYLLDR